MKQRHTFYAAVYLVLRRGNAILLADRINTGFADGQWSMIAGHIEANESTFKALGREAYEEGGLTIAVADMKVLHLMHRKALDGERFDIFIEAKQFEGEPRIAEPDKCSRMEWFPVNALPEMTVDYVRHAIECIERGEIYSEFGW